ncbi:MAG: hypothetical protein AB1626_04730 [Candidatus Micrarchaeota archaeon]
MYASARHAYSNTSGNVDCTSRDYHAYGDAGSWRKHVCLRAGQRLYFSRLLPLQPRRQHHGGK